MTEAARIREQHGHLAAEQHSWSQRPLLNRQAGRPRPPRHEYSRARADQARGNRSSWEAIWQGLADLLQNQPGRSREGAQLAASRSDHPQDPGHCTEQTLADNGVGRILPPQAAGAADDRLGPRCEAGTRLRQLPLAPRFLLP